MTMKRRLSRRELPPGWLWIATCVPLPGMRMPTRREWERMREAVIRAWREQKRTLRPYIYWEYEHGISRRLEPEEELRLLEEAGECTEEDRRLAEEITGRQA